MLKMPSRSLHEAVSQSHAVLRLCPVDRHRKQQCSDMTGGKARLGVQCYTKVQIFRKCMRSECVHSYSPGFVVEENSKKTTSWDGITEAEEPEKSSI